MQAEGGLSAFNDWFTQVKEEYDAFAAEHDGQGPVTDWVRQVVKAATNDKEALDALEGMTDEEGYEAVAKYLPKKAKVRVTSGRQY